jgi:hypothetical protein
MASFPELRYLLDLPSGSTEGFRLFRGSLHLAVPAALLHAVVAAFLTVSELATLRGAAKATPASPTRASGAFSGAGPLVVEPYLHSYSRVPA